MKQLVPKYIELCKVNYNLETKIFIFSIQCLGEEAETSKNI